MRLRLLIVEDNQARFEAIEALLPVASPELTWHVVHAKDGPAALGVLNLDRNVYDAVMLDHDLGAVNGQTVAQALIRSHALRKPPVLVHSMNADCAPRIANLLEKAGFDVELKPMIELDRAILHEWLKYAAELALDHQD